MKKKSLKQKKRELTVYLGIKEGKQKQLGGKMHVTLRNGIVVHAKNKRELLKKVKKYYPSAKSVIFNIVMNTVHIKDKYGKIWAIGKVEW